MTLRACVKCGVIKEIKKRCKPCAKNYQSKEIFCSNCGLPRKGRCNSCRNVKRRLKYEYSKNNLENLPWGTPCPKCNMPRKIGIECKPCRKIYSQKPQQVMARKIKYEVLKKEPIKNEKCICCGLIKQVRKRCKNCKKEYDKIRLQNLRKKNPPTIRLKIKNPYCNKCGSLKNISCKNCKKEKNKLKHKLNYIPKPRKRLSKEEIKNRRKAYNLKRREKNKIDINYKIRTSISAAIFKALKSKNGTKNKQSCLKFLPYTIIDLKNHIEYLFESWMTWDNWGKYNNISWNDNDSKTWTWQLDHIIPQSKFKFLSMENEEFQKCWALENLRPYSAKLNITEGARR